MQLVLETSFYSFFPLTRLLLNRDKSVKKKGKKKSRVAVTIEENVGFKNENKFDRLLVLHDYTYEIKKISMLYRDDKVRYTS